MSPRTLLVLFIAFYSFSAQGAETVATQSRPTALGDAGVDQSTSVASIEQRRDLLQARLWGLEVSEIKRARDLMTGPRGAFSVANISPLEILGIHARNEQERRRYAELMARVMVEDTQRILAFQQEYDAAVRRLYPGIKTVDFGPGGAPKNLPSSFFGGVK
ncbi:hypothetical protein [Nitrogeniibacter aestuarii]|uniref:hypothetical protein n=1 Tax=Nitrogeniibacter aestuarii TaxID=2815343 RepID=UPI001E51DCCE|nr:hypothetical protein [Nitrogeniibacter aestuarii]